MQYRERIVAVDDIVPNQWNYNVQSSFMFEKEKESITEFGFVDPILVRSFPKKKKVEIIDGEHRWRAAMALGYKDVPVLDAGIVTDNVAKQISVVMNETKGEANLGKLATLIKELDFGEAGLGGVPFTKEEMTDLIGWDWKAAEVRGVVPVVLGFSEKQLETFVKAVEKKKEQLGEKFLTESIGTGLGANRTEEAIAFLEICRELDRGKKKGRTKKARAQTS